jgi:DNA-binding transcriptional regulator YiaG
MPSFDPASSGFDGARFPPIPALSNNTTEPITDNRISTGSPSEAAAAIEAVLNRKGSAAELINALKTHIPRIGYLYEKKPPFDGQYRLDDHSHAVIRQFDKYFADSQLPGGVRPELIRLTLALHDAGKYIPESTADQHAATLEVIKSIRDSLPVSNEEFSIMLALIDGDPIGQASIRLCDKTRFIRCSLSKTIEDLRNYCEATAPPIPDDATIDRESRIAFDEICKMSQRTNLSVEDFTRILVQYYQCDSSAYSVDGELLEGKRAHAALEFLYSLGDKLPSKEGEKLFIMDSGLGIVRPREHLIRLFEKILGVDNSDIDSQH